MPLFARTNVISFFSNGLKKINRRKSDHDEHSNTEHAYVCPLKRRILVRTNHTQQFAACKQHHNQITCSILVWPDDCMEKNGQSRDGTKSPHFDTPIQKFARRYSQHDRDSIQWFPNVRMWFVTIRCPSVQHISRSHCITFIWAAVSPKSDSNIKIRQEAIHY